MLASFITAAVLVACEPNLPAEAHSDSASVVDIDFEAFLTGDLSVSSRLTGSRLIGKLTRRAEVVEEGTANKALRADYPKGRVGPRESGVLFLVRLPPAAEYYLTYRLRLDDGFDFRNGGKLPGLSSEGCRFSGGRIPAAGEGWSARLSWTPAGTLGVYLYHAAMSGPWGDLLRLAGGPLRRNEWHTLVQRVRLNTGDESNGILQVWIDGALALDRTDVRFRSGRQGAIEALCFSTFHGGTDPAQYGPLTTGTALFDDILVVTEPPSVVRRQLEPASGPR